MHSRPVLRPDPETRDNGEQEKAEQDADGARRVVKVPPDPRQRQQAGCQREAEDDLREKRVDPCKVELRERVRLRKRRDHDHDCQVWEHRASRQEEDRETGERRRGE